MPRIQNIFLPDSSSTYPERLLALFLFLTFAISILGWWAYATEARYLRQREYAELKAISDFKAAQIKDWLAERRWDAKLLFDSPFSRQDFSRWLENGDSLAGQRLKERLESLCVNDNCLGVELLGPDGKARLVVGADQHDAAETTPDKLSAIDKRREPQLVDLHRDGPGLPIRLAFLQAIPGTDREGETSPLGYLRLTIDPTQRLYPLLQSWPTPSPSAETLIVRREGDSVLYLNDLRHLPGTALELRQPLHGSNNPATRAVLGEEGFFEGKDYREMEVISYLRPIPGTPWHMVTQVDREEVFENIRQIAFATLVASVLLLLFSGLLLRLWWRRQQLLVRLHLRQDLERIADVSPGVIHSFWLQSDGSMAFPYSSPAIQDVFGFPAEQLAKDASPVLARIHADDAGRIRARLEASARDLAIWQAEYRYQHPEKGEIWVEEKSVPTRLADGSTVWQGFLSDVTDRKKAEQALRETELRFSTVFRDSPLGITLSRTTDGLFIEANDAFLGIFGLTREQVIGHTSIELNVWGDPAERGRMIRKLQAEGTLRNMETKFRRQSGELLDILYSAGMIDVAGECYLLSLFSDITPQRRAELELATSRERYRSLFEHMLEGCALCCMRYEAEVAADFVFLDVNPAFEALTGLREVIGKRLGEIFPDFRQAVPDLFEACARVARTGQSERLETYIAPLEQWFSFTMFSAEPEYFVAVFDNINNRKQAEFALEAYRDQLEKEVTARTAELVAVNKELHAFTYAASHDLKAPLRGISGFATLLKRDYGERLEGDGVKYLDHICNSADRMRSLIDDLLEYAHLEQQTGQLRSVDLRGAVISIVSERQEEIRHRGADVRLNLPGPLVVLADPHGLDQVLRNLVENALKYSGKSDHPLVEIGGESLPDCCRVWIRDNGIGFDMAYHDKIFEIFRRLHSGEEFSGTGVGLALVRKAMERMGGKVWANSAPGQGATFYLEFPVEPTSAV